MYIYLFMERARKIVLLLTVGLFLSGNGFAQYDNTPFLHNLPQDSAKVRSVFLNFETLSFLKNNEYSSYIADGYTLFGFQFLPYFSYQPVKNVRVNAGVYLQKDFGNNDFTRIEPYFSVKLSRKNLNVIFGNLEGSLNHRLIEPLYDFERVLNDRQEFGLQFQYNRRNFTSDLWVNWENFIYRGDSEQEEITGGLILRKSFQLSSLEIGVPIQLFVYHKGGQIDSSSDNLLTRLNAAGGIDLRLNLGDFLQSVHGSAFYIHSINDDPNLDNSPRAVSPPSGPFLPQYPEASKGDTLVYGNGKGFFANLGLDLKHNIRLMASFWIADNFASPRGGQLYPSESSSFKKAGLVVNRRTLIIARLFHDWKITNRTTFTTRFEPYWDLNTNAFEYSFGFYLNFRPEFLIWNGK